MGFKSATSEGKLKNGQRGTLTPTLSEKASMCLLLAEVLEKIQKGSPEAIKVHRARSRIHSLPSGVWIHMLIYVF